MNPQTQVKGGLSGLNDAQLAEIQASLGRISTSGAFGSSPRRGELLRYLVEKALAGNEPSEYAVGRDIFGRPDSFDPRQDSIVRTEISRLRQKLKDYYTLEGASDRVSIEIPQRSYTPSIAFREPQPAAARHGNKLWWLMAVIPTAAVVVTLAIWVGTRWMAGPANTLAVLPFQNLSPNGATAYVADGVTEELTNELAQRRDLRVVARTSASVFKNQAADIREIGRRLNVAAVLEGSVSVEAGHVRVTAQLNRTRDGYHLWSRAFEAPYSEIMQLQARVVEGVHSAIQPKEAPAGAYKTSTTSAAAHDLCLQANYQLAQRTPASMRKALELFESALEQDPRYVDAYRGVARTEIGLIHITAEAPRDGYERARKALETAFQIDPDDAETLGELADLHYGYDWDWPRAENEFRQAIEHGAQSTTHSYYGWCLATRGRFKEAHDQLRLAQDLDPLGSGPVINEVTAYMLERRLDDARRLLENSLMSRAPLDAQIQLGLIALYRHDCGESESRFESVESKVPPALGTLVRAFSAACRGETDQARSYLAAITTGQQSGFASPYQIAMGYAAIHDNDSAIAYLVKSGEAREGQIFYIPYDPIFDGIRSDPRFTELERKLRIQ